MPRFSYEIQRRLDEFVDDESNRQNLYLVMIGFRQYEIEKMTPLARSGYATIYNEFMEQMYGDSGGNSGNNIPPEIRSQITMPR